MVFMGIKITEQIKKRVEIVNAQEILDTYLRGHHPDGLKEGFNLDVLEVKSRLFIAFVYPKNQGHPSYHPWSNEEFIFKVTGYLNDNGYPGRPVWGYQMYR